MIAFQFPVQRLPRDDVLRQGVHAHGYDFEAALKTQFLFQKPTAPRPARQLTVAHGGYVVKGPFPWDKWQLVCRRYELLGSAALHAAHIIPLLGVVDVKGDATAKVHKLL
jgi:hypothetical protein